MTSSTKVQMLVPYGSSATREHLARQVSRHRPKLQHCFFHETVLKYLVHKQTEAFFASQKDVCFMNQNVLDRGFYRSKYTGKNRDRAHFGS